MITLPDLLLAHGIELRQRGNEFQCLCFAHDDHHPSMSVYVNGDGTHKAHCFSCGYHQGAVGAYCTLNGLDYDNKEHLAIAIKALEGEAIIDTGKRHARIIDDPTPKLPDRTTMIPPPGHDLPRMDYIKTRDNEPFGAPDTIYTFRQPDGEPWYYEARWDNINGRKECRVFTYGARGEEPPRWSCQHYNAPRPLYGLDKVSSMAKAQILICEGPRKAEAAQQLLTGLAAVGWSGGAQSWKKADWTPIAGRKCILWPDADDPGRTAMAELAQHLIGQGCECWILDTTAQPDKWDAADALAEGWDTARTLAWCKAVKGEKIEPSGNPGQLPAEPVAPEDMSEFALPPMSDNPPEYVQDAPPLETYQHGTSEQPFPPDPIDLFQEFAAPPLKRGLLPQVIEDHVFDLAEVINTDPAFGAITALSAIAGLLDDRIKIKISEGYTESARLWTMACGEPSTKKSPIMDAVLSPLGAIAKKVAQEDAKIRQRQEILDARYKSKLKEYTEASIKSDDHDLPEPTPAERLERKRVKCDNLTREALEEVLRDMPSGCYLHADELAGWIGSMDAYKSAGVKADRALWLRAFNGGPMQIDRIGRGSYMIDNWSMTISGGIQPSKLSSMAGQLDDDGLLQRFLIVSSSRAGGQGLDRPINKTYKQQWNELLDHIADTKPGGGYVTMTDEAYAIRRAAVAHIYEIINSRMIGRAFSTALGKWEGVSARLMLCFHAAECAAKHQHPESVQVSPETAQLAINYMMQHLLPHMVSFYEDGLGESAASSVSKLLAGHIIAESLGEITTTSLHKSGPGKWRNGSTALQNESLNRLVEMGWIVPANTANNATKRPTRYRVNPHVHTLFANHADKERKRIENARAIGAHIRAGTQGPYTDD